MGAWPFSFGGKQDNAGRQKVRKVLDEILEFVSTGRNSSFLDLAKEEYFGKVGGVYEDDHDFEHRMNTFLEWFAFDFRSATMGPDTVFTMYINENRDNFSSEDMVFRMTISKHLHSVFMVKGFKEGMIKVKDLAGGKSFWVTDDELFEKGDLFETRIITVGDSNFFSYTYCLHPRVSAKLIRNAFKKRHSVGFGPDFFVRLHAMQLKWRRSRQIEVKDIYNFQ